MPRRKRASLYQVDVRPPAGPRPMDRARSIGPKTGDCVDRDASHTFPGS